MEKSFLLNIISIFCTIDEDGMHLKTIHVIDCEIMTYIIKKTANYLKLRKIYALQSVFYQLFMLGHNDFSLHIVPTPCV